MRISEIMTADVRAIAPDRTVRDAARLMDELNVGILPVCEGERLVGVVTDRDITVRSTAAGLAPAQHAVREIMTTQPAACRPEDDSADVLRRMGELQVRRMPVVEAGERLVGMVSLGDLADDGVPGAGEALRRISTPAEPDRTGTPSTRRADATRDGRPSPLSDEERRELERRASQPEEPRRDGGRAPDPAQGGGGAQGGFAPRDEDDARAAFGIAGAPTQAGGSPSGGRGTGG